MNDERIKLIVSEKLIEELTNKITSRKFHKYFSISEAEKFIELLKQVSEIINPLPSVTICRDPKDNFLLDLAKHSKADYLITGDNDLLVVQNFENTKIISLNQFLKVLSKPLQ